MTDRDIIERLAALTGIGRVSAEKPRPGKKPVWAWGVGVRQHREWLTQKVWPWLGQRRRARILELWPEAEHAAALAENTGSTQACRSARRELYG
jgi:hypothetical protein